MRLLLFNYLQSSDSLKHVTTSEENCILKELCRRYGANLDEVGIWFLSFVVFRGLLDPDTLSYFVSSNRITKCIPRCITCNFVIV